MVRRHINGEPLDVRPFLDAHPGCEIELVQAGGQATFVCIPHGVVVTADAIAAGLPVDHYPFGRDSRTVDNEEDREALEAHEIELVHLRQQMESRP